MKPRWSLIGFANSFTASTRNRFLKQLKKNLAPTASFFLSASRVVSYKVIYFCKFCKYTYVYADKNMFTDKRVYRAFIFANFSFFHLHSHKLDFNNIFVIKDTPFFQQFVSVLGRFVERTNKLFTSYQSTFRRYQLHGEKLNPANRWISRSFLNYFLHCTKNLQNVIEGRL